MKKERRIWGIVNVGLFLFLAPMVTFAAAADATFAVPDSSKESGKLVNPLLRDDILSLIYLLVDSLMKVGMVAAACFIIYSGFLFVTARGESEKITQAKNNFFWTIIGAAILLGARVIVSIISGTLKSF